jgi:diguanylate cyclase (GGDEF)-like protein
MASVLWQAEHTGHRQRATAVLCASATILLCLLTLAGWFFRIKPLVQLLPGTWSMVVASACCCLAVAAALLLCRLSPQSSHKWCTRGTVAISSLVIVVAVMALVENLWPVSLGIDLPRLHAALLPEYTPPGQMGPNAAFALILLCVSLILHALRGAERYATAARILLSFALLLSLTGLITQWLDLQALYPWFETIGFVRMSPMTSICLLLLSLGMWSQWNEVVGQAWSDERVEAMGILQTAALILMVTALTTGVTGVALLQGQLIREMRENLREIGRDRLTSVDQTLVQRVDRAALVANQAAIISEVKRYALRPDDGAMARELEEAAQGLLKHGFAAVAFETSGQRRIEAGKMLSAAEMVIPLRAEYPATLMWQQGYYLETRVPVADASGTYGHMVSQQRLFSLDRITEESNHWGRTGEMLVCTSKGDGLSCFPSRSHPTAFVVEGAALRPELPILQAVNGRSGAGIARDIRNHRVLAAYGPVGASGLGMVIKMDTAEVLEPIRGRLQVATPLIALLVLGGLWVMQRRVKPLIRKLMSTQEYIRHLATHDALTGLPNRVLLEDRLEVAIRYASRNDEQVALMLVDLDHFKPINDTMGHAVGDQLLQQVAQRLRRAIRAADTAARFGGDEFVLLLSRTHHPEGTAAVAAKVIESLGEPVHLDTCTVSITPSIGIACFPQDGGDMRTLLRHADLAMYAAKYGGRNAFRMYEHGMAVDSQAAG